MTGTLPQAEFSEGVLRRAEKTIKRQGIMHLRRCQLEHLGDAVVHALHQEQLLVLGRDLGALLGGRDGLLANLLGADLRLLADALDVLLRDALDGEELLGRRLGDLVAAGDRAIVLVEHNLDAAIGFVDRVVVLDAAGRLLADGHVDDVLRRRADELHRLGVWLPHSALAALRLRRAGYALAPLPLTPAELRDALEATPPVAAPREASAPAATRATGDPVVRVRGLEVRRGRTDVLHGVDLEVRRGEFVAIVGANGAGKTTLVQAIAGVIRPPRGSVSVDGADIARVDPRRLSSRIGFVFQNPEHQFIAHTVYDELAHGLRRTGLDEAAVRERVDEMLARFGLSERADAHPFLLSGGQKRRLSVGTALIGGAPVLALDEPTFGQDRARADELLRLLAELRADGTTILVVTHDMQLVAEHAERMVVVDAGRIAADGATADVFADDALLERTGLRMPPLRRALHGLASHPDLAGVARLADLPGGER